MMLKDAMILVLFAGVAQALFYKPPNPCAWSLVGDSCEIGENTGTCKPDINPVLEKLIPKVCVVTPEPTTTTVPPSGCDVAALGLPAEAAVQPPFSSPPMTGDFSIVAACDEGFEFGIKATCTADGFAFSVDCVAIEQGKRSTNTREARSRLVDGLRTRSTQPVCNDEPLQFELLGAFDPPFSHPAVEDEEGTLICDEGLVAILQFTCTESGFELSPFCT